MIIICVGAIVRTVILNMEVEIIAKYLDIVNIQSNSFANEDVQQNDTIVNKFVDLQMISCLNSGRREEKGKCHFKKMNKTDCSMSHHIIIFVYLHIQYCANTNSHLDLL